MAQSPKTPNDPDVGVDPDETSVKVQFGSSHRQNGPAEGATDPEDGSGGDSPAAAVPSPAPEIEQLRRERDDYYERLLRKTAEFENYRKRTDRERREQAEYVTADVLGSVLPLVDSLERALAVEAGPDGDAYRRGVEIIHKQMLDLLRKHNVTPIEAVGTAFDPHVHEAVIHEVSPGSAEGEVIGELQRGYRLGDRLLRPAMVKVAKA
jgi:molecular chaperone GrpE